MFHFQKKEYFFFVPLFCFFTLAITGCDQISNIKSKQTPKPAVAQENPSPANEIKTGAKKDQDVPLPPNVLMKVGDWTLTIDNFNERIQAVKKIVSDFDETNIEAKKMILDELKRQQLLVQEAKAEKVNESKEIKDAVTDFENTLLVQEMIGRLTQDIKVSESEASDFYDANPDMFIKPIEKNIREIVVNTETEARDILVQLLQGADFAQMARTKSKAKSAADGGALGFKTRAPFEQMLKAAEGLTKGGISTVFQGPEGYYIIKIEDIKGGDKADFEEIKNDLIKGLTIQKQQQAVKDKLEAVTNKVNVKVNEDLLKKTGE